MKTDNAQIKTCQIIIETKPENFRLNLWEKIFYCFHFTRITGGLMLIKNTDEQINKRYIFDINGKLPVLKFAV